MFVSLSRVFAVAVVVLSLAALSVPTVQAAPLGGKAPSIEIRADWFEAAMSWIGNLFSGREARPASRPALSTQQLTDTTMAVMSGSCIDPQGRPRPCMEF